MAEYIEREAALKELNKNSITKKITYADGVSIFDTIKNIPTADVVEVKHGYWINTPPYIAMNGAYNKAQECSVCSAFFVSDGNTPYSNHPYCCECGAKMDLKEGAEE